MAIEMSDLLQLVIDEGASDLHLPVGSPPVLRIHGGMQPLDTPPLNGDDTERLMKSITSDDHQQRVRQTAAAKSALQPLTHRFTARRAGLFQRDQIAAVVVQQR